MKERHIAIIERECNIDKYRSSRSS